LKLLSGLYRRGAEMRRSWYTNHTDRRRHLDRPVISVGNLAVGGTGKTPLVEHVVSLLRRQGERPAILSRGYARSEPSEGVLVASDGRGLVQRVEQTGDEPQMLAQALPDVPVFVSADRFTAGRLAERQFACTVHVLDDGFQNVQLARDVDLLAVAGHDLHDTVLPSGRLREPLSAATAADALVVNGSIDEAAAGEMFPGKPVFRAVARYEPLRALHTQAGMPANPRRVVAVAGIAGPERFFNALRAQGLEVVDEVTFRDHHWFTAADVQRIEGAATVARADVIVTTAKDAVRIKGRRGAAALWTVLPMTLSVEPPDEFEAWLLERLRIARSARGTPSGSPGRP
jgi:tetraacyldisaccharide 4'-kinase